MNAQVSTPSTEAAARPVPRVAWTRPAVDLAETERGLALVFDVPGVPKDGVSVTVDGRTLTIEGKRGPTRGYRHAFTLPDSLDAGSVEAALADGVLTVRLARVAKPEPKRIAVH